MPSTYTSLLRLTLPADGELIGTWGQVVNNGITTLEETAIAGTVSIALADANRTLTTANGATDEARNMTLLFTGALTAQRDIIVPNSSKIYFVRNATTGGFGLNVKTAAAAGTVVPNGQAMLLWVSPATGTVSPAISTVVGTGVSLIGDGAVGAPGLAFISDTDTGLYRIGADSMGFATNGALRLTIATAGSTFTGNVYGNTQVSAPNFWVGETAGAAGTVGISGGLGASTVYWGNSSAGAGGLNLYTGGGLAINLLRTVGAVNYFELQHNVAAAAIGFAAQGSDTNIGINFISKGMGALAFWSHYGGALAQFVISPAASANRYMVVGGALNANPTIADSSGIAIRFANCGWQVVGVGRPWSGAVPESQTYAYNIALGICNATAAANTKIHEWYKDAASLYGLWISDDLSAATQWLQVNGGQSTGTTAIYLTATGGGVGLISMNTGSGGVVITGTATSNGTLALSDTGAAGMNIKMTGNGATTPKKFLRVAAGEFQVISDAYTLALLTVAESGAVTNLNGIEFGFRGSPLNGYTGATTLLLADRGKTHYKTDATQVTVPAGTFAGGDTVVILNWSGANMTVVQGVGLGMYKGGSVSTGNRTILGVGIATVLFETANSAVITGNIT